MNTVSCGECGYIFTHEKGYEGELKCEKCGFEEDQCWFPDFDTSVFPL